MMGGGFEKEMRRQIEVSVSGACPWGRYERKAFYAHSEWMRKYATAAKYIKVPLSIAEVSADSRVRYAIDYLRHRHTNYDILSRKLKLSGARHEVIVRLRDMVNDAILEVVAAAYPDFYPRIRRVVMTDWRRGQSRSL